MIGICLFLHCCLFITTSYVSSSSAFHLFPVLLFCVAVCIVVFPLRFQTIETSSFSNYFCYSLSYIHRYAVGVISNLCSPLIPRDSSPEMHHNCKYSACLIHITQLRDGWSFLLNCWVQAPVHYCTFLHTTDSTNQSLFSVLKAPALVTVSLLYAGFLRTACSHVADQVSRQACWTGL